MLRWLEPENGQAPEKWLPDEKLRQKIRVIVETGQTMIRLQNVAVSRTAGIWQIKRSKIILGFLDGLGIEKLVTKVRVPPESIVKCLNRFAQMGLQYFDHPERKPTKREMSVAESNTGHQRAGNNDITNFFRPLIFPTLLESIGCCSIMKKSENYLKSPCREIACHFSNAPVCLFQSNKFD